MQHVRDVPFGALDSAIVERFLQELTARHPAMVPFGDPYRVRGQELFDERLLVVAGKQSPWAHRRKIDLVELMDEPWIIIPSDSVPGALVADAFHAAGQEVPRASVLTHSIPLRNSLLAGGRFLTVFANSMLHFSANHLPVKILPVDLPIKSRPVGIITLKNRTQSPLVQLFIECASEVAKSIAKPRRHRR